MTPHEALDAYLAADTALLDAIGRGEVRDEYHPRALARLARLDALRGSLDDSERLAAGLRDDLERLRERLRPWQDAAADATTLRTRAEAERDAALAHAEELTRALRIADRTHDATLAERDALRAIIDGRTTPPTEAEIEAHDAAGGWWLYLPERGIGRCSCSACRTAQMPAGELLPGNVRMVAAVGGGRWWALDAQRRPCAWPVVTEAP